MSFLAHSRKMKKTFSLLMAFVMVFGFLAAAGVQVHADELEDLEAYLQENGWTELFSQGNQEPYNRARPQGQTYNAINANYQKIIKQLDSMLPKDDRPTGDPDDGFDAFVHGRDDP